MPVQYVQQFLNAIYWVKLFDNHNFIKLNRSIENNQISKKQGLDVFLQNQWVHNTFLASSFTFALYNSGRLDRSVYKQGQVVCPTVECTVEKGEDGSLMANLKLEFPALTDEYERLKSYSMGIFDNKWWLFEDSTYVNMLIVNFFGNISNELWVINVFVLTSAGVFM